MQSNENVGGERTSTAARRARGWTVVVTIAACALGAVTGTAEAQTAPPGQPQIVIVQAQPAQAQPQPVYVQAQPYGQPQAYGQPQPGYGYAAVPPARRERGPNLGLIVGGAVMLGVGWLVNILVGLPAGDDPFRSRAEPEWEAFRGSSFIPLAGPWVQLGVKPTGFTEDYWAIWLIIDGLLQTAGTTMLIVGAATSGGDDDAVASIGGVELRVMPSIGPDHAALSIAGRF